MNKLKFNNLIYEGKNSLIYYGKEKNSITKILRNEFPSNKQILKFYNEYTYTQELKKINGIRDIYKKLKIDNKHAMIMQYFDGKNLKDAFKKQRNFEDFFKIVIKIASILAKIHKHNIIHKNINPENILVNLKTCDVRIIDFGISTKIDARKDSLTNPSTLEGTLAYIAPEQTGRMNRIVDLRSDLYSLGVTFYEMLTQRLPFEAKDALELVHSHIAKKPKPPCKINASIPDVLSDIVLKLMKKNVEDRYQSAEGLLSDLKKCLTQYKKTQSIKSFKIGKEDFLGRFLIPQKLYGVENQIKTLLEAFERVTLGASEFILIAGYSGVGKSSLVYETHKQVTAKNGYFVKGKYDQFKKNIPYSVFIYAFTEFVDILLTESNEKLAYWKKIILDGVGNNGQVLIDIIPSLELIIGKQNEVIKVDPVEIQNRLNLVFESFIKNISQKDHPLVLFLDDLQWIDSASLNLLKVLVSDYENKYFLLIGAYRDNEVDVSHPLMIALNDFKKENVNFSTITLQNLSKSNVNELVTDTLHSKKTQVKPLSNLIYTKTHGNAFFVNQFLKSLNEEKLVFYNFEKHKWIWDIKKINNKNITDNVVELMANKIKTLPNPTQTILQYAACIGNIFDLQTISIIYSKFLIKDLEVAMNEGLVVPQNNNYKLALISSDDTNISFQNQLKIEFKFLHDRVQQASYSLISKDKVKLIHLKVGRLLLESTSETELEDKIFDIVNQLNYSLDLIKTKKEKRKIAKLNLITGNKAKKAAAYKSSLDYYSTGVGLLDKTAWKTDYKLMFDLTKCLAEALYLNGDFDKSEKLIWAALDKAKSIFDKVNLYSLLIELYTLISKNEEAINIGRKALKLLNVVLPYENIPKAIQLELEKIKKNMSNRQINSLIDLPKMKALEKEVECGILTQLIRNTYYFDIVLCQFIVAKLINNFLAFGNILSSPFVYAAYGALIGPVFNENYSLGYKFSLLALKLSEKLDNSVQKSKVCEVLVSRSIHWTKHVKISYKIANQGYLSALEVGNFQLACYNLTGKIFSLFNYMDLKSVIQEIPPILAFIKKAKIWEVLAKIILSYQLVIMNLIGHTKNKKCFYTDEITEKMFLYDYNKHKIPRSLCLYYILKMQVSFIYDEPAAALEYSNKAYKLLSYILGWFVEAEFNFYHSLILMVLYENESEKNKLTYLTKVKNNQKQMEIWADNCKDNFLHKYYLVEAEIARNQGENLDALKLYNQSIFYANKYEFMQNEAMAHELCAKLHFKLGFKKYGKYHIKQAHYGYKLWGAKHKVCDLEEKYRSYIFSTKDSKHQNLDKKTISIHTTTTETGNTCFRH